jgi:hypothetical protein
VTPISLFFNQEAKEDRMQNTVVMFARKHVPQQAIAGRGEVPPGEATR